MQNVCKVPVMFLDPESDHTISDGSDLQRREQATGTTFDSHVGDKIGGRLAVHDFTGFKKALQDPYGFVSGIHQDSNHARLLLASHPKLLQCLHLHAFENRNQRRSLKPGERMILAHRHIYRPKYMFTGVPV